MKFTLHLGKCIEAMRAMPDNSVDSIVTDPPYGLSFMGKRWDYDVPSVEIWAECLRVLKPGGHLLAFAGTRTQHRMAVRIEDAGFEIRDMIAWIYGSGFPKSLNVAKSIESGGGRPEDIRRMQLGDEYVASGRGRRNYDHGAASAMDSGAQQWEPTHDAAKQWRGWGTALKPALEPITVARKPLIGTVAANVLAHGAGGINIDGCRVAPTGESRERVGEASQDQRYADAGGTNFAAKPGIRGGDPSGRWPANLIHDGSDEVVALFPDAPGQQGASSDNQRTRANCYGALSHGGKQYEPRADTGSAARFFYCAKASRKDRNEGLAIGDQKAVGTNATMRQVEDADWPARNGNHHPTVKPTDLMAYLLRLVTPPGGTVLDPFMGSGSTGKAAMREGFNFIGCELDPEYLAIAKARIEHELSKVNAARQQPTESQLSLFGS
ncbi:MAG: site-specific DNA-methyltransferase [Pseudomonas sp.]|uniref:DNA-methyltransferase n=1 Tax=Pseudomonas sp. TaxID=306 RepID=UPI001DCF90B9|nr:site-specific DNA-methyltransferase [Pseudomonas sp.]MPS98248.1 site-specific DNA-methyltransferase [Pseudomonas sp.]